MKTSLRSFLHPALVLSAVVLMITACSKKDINASRQLEEKYRRASAEIERGHSSGKYQTVEATPSNEVVTEETTPATSAPAVSAPEKTSAPAKAHKPTLKEKVANKIIQKKLEKYTKSPDQVQNHDQTNALDYNLKMAIIFAVVALIVGILAAVIWPFWIVSLILWIVALVFFIMWIMEQ